MEASLKRSGFANYHKVYARIVRKEETQDCVVSDTMPDIAELVTTWGNVLIRSKDVSEGRVRVEANIPAKVTFRPEEGESLCCLDVNVPLYFSAEDAAIHDGAICITELKLRTLETRVLNPRKVTVRAEAELALECYEAGETLFSTADACCDRGIHVRQRELTVTAVGSVTEKTFVLTDELTLPEELPSATEVLGQQTGICMEELKTVGSKVILKGTVRSVLFYRTDADGTAAASFSTEFSQIIDTDCETETTRPVVRLLLSGVYYDVAPGYNGRTLRLEVHAVAQLTLYQEHSVSCLTDAYSNIYPLELKREQRPLFHILREETLHGALREELSAPKAVSEILECTAECLSAAPEAEGIALTLRARLLCRDAEGGLFGVTQTLAVVVPTETGEGESLLVHNVALGEPGAVPSARGAELRLTAEVKAYLALNGEVDCIQDIAYDEAALLDLSAQPSLVIMKVRSSDDLWQLARENCSTVQAICQANGLDEASEPWEKLLLLPRTI